MAKTKNKKTTTKKDTVKPKKNKKKYKVRNWKEYNEMLVNRGRIDVWVEKGILEQWFAEPGKKRKRGAKKKYSDKSIEVTLQFGQVFHQKLRQTEGLVKTIFQLMKIDLEVPDFTTLSRRGETITVDLPREKRETVSIIVDSSGLKVYGEGEWKVRKHGWGKHRTWRKIHLAVTPDGEIREEKLTENSVSDDHVFPELIKQETNIDKAAGDGAYDKSSVYEACQEKEINIIAIPPQKNAVIWQHGNCKDKPHPRDENLRAIRKSSRPKWKKEIGYHVRSIGENVYFRWKTIFGDKLNARKMETQITEARIKAVILNKMRLLGMPDSYAVN
jgi:hypothetical protein